MYRYLKHHARLAGPLLLLSAIVAVTARYVDAVRSVAAIGEGLDVVTLRVSGISGTLSAWAGDAHVWIGVAALAATSVSVISAFRQLGEWIHGPADMMAMARHATDRVKTAAGTGTAPVSWGIVHDAQSGLPIPLARVRVQDGRGGTLASAVSDMQGRYGFHEAFSTIAGRGGVAGFEASHDGYHRSTTAIPVSAGIAHSSFDIALQPHGGLNTSADGGIAGRLSGHALWVGMLSVPMTALMLSPPFGAGLVALFGCSAIVHAVGTGYRTDATHASS